MKDAKFEEWSSAVETLEYSSETPMGEVTARGPKNPRDGWGMGTDGCPWKLVTSQQVGI